MISMVYAEIVLFLVRRFRYFKTSPEIIQLAVMMYARFPLLLRNVEDSLVSHQGLRNQVYELYKRGFSVLGAI